MRKLMTMVIALAMTLLGAKAQRIQTVDTNGNPVAYATIADAAGKMIGITDLEGVLADVKGAKTVSVTHVAFKPLTVGVEQLGDGRITLEDADFNLPEITVKKADYLYVQTYYRVAMISNDTVFYYRGGTIDNIYDLEKKTLSTDRHHLSKATVGLMCFMVDKILGVHLDRISQLPEGTPEQRIASDRMMKNRHLTLSGETATRRSINDRKGRIGYLVNDKASLQQRLSIDLNAMAPTEKQEMKAAKRAAKDKKGDDAGQEKWQRNNKLYEVYRIDDDGNSTVGDFMRKQVMFEWESESGEHRQFFIESYVIDRAYISKKELKQVKRDHKPMLTLNGLLELERQNNIPPLRPLVQKSLQELFK